MALVLSGTLNIDCNNISCLTFVDTTGAYSLSNLNGYGSPNPEISEIVSTTFLIVDSNGDDWTFIDSGYSPNSAGNSSICLDASNFVDGGGNTLSLVPGATYTLYYSVNFSGQQYDLNEDFTFPCCGNPITSNLTTTIAIEQNQGCASFVFSDVTGLYNADTNVGGYGTPNPAFADISSTLITFELSNGETVSIDSFLPTAADHSITITASDLGYTSFIPDQIMNVTYSVFVDGDCRVGYKNTSVLLYCQTESCINAKIAEILTEDCDCSGSGNNSVDNVMKMLFELDALKIVASRNMSCANGKIEELLKKCNAGCSYC